MTHEMNAALQCSTLSCPSERSRTSALARAGACSTLGTASQRLVTRILNVVGFAFHERVRRSTCSIFVLSRPRSVRFAAACSSIRGHCAVQAGLRGGTGAGAGGVWVPPGRVRFTPLSRMLSHSWIRPDSLREMAPAVALGMPPEKDQIGQAVLNSSAVPCCEWLIGR